MQFLITDYEQQDCSDLHLGMENKAIPDTSFYPMAESMSGSGMPLSSYPRLGSTGGWCISPLSPPYFKVSLRVPHFICAIGTQGHSDTNLYVTAYKIELSIKSSASDYYMENGVIKVCIQKLKRLFHDFSI